jgi:hypothetical protein
MFNQWTSNGRWQRTAGLGLAGLILFLAILIVNIAANGYDEEPFLSSSYNVSFAAFPAKFLRGSLKRQPGCEPFVIKRGDGMPRF